MDIRVSDLKVMGVLVNTYGITAEQANALVYAEKGIMKEYDIVSESLLPALLAEFTAEWLDEAPLLLENLYVYAYENKWDIEIIPEAIRLLLEVYPREQLIGDPSIIRDFLLLLFKREEGAKSPEELDNNVYLLMQELTPEEVRELLAEDPRFP